LGLLRGELKDFPGVVHFSVDEMEPGSAGCGGDGCGGGAYPPLLPSPSPLSPLPFLSTRPLAVVVMPTAAPPDATDPAALAPAFAADDKDDEDVNLDRHDGEYLPLDSFRLLLHWRIGGHLGGRCTSPPLEGHAADLILPSDLGVRRRPLDALFGIPRAAIPPRRLRGPLPPPLSGAI